MMWKPRIQRDDYTTKMLDTINKHWTTPGGGKRADWSVILGPKEFPEFSFAGRHQQPRNARGHRPPKNPQKTIIPPPQEPILSS